MLHVTNGDCAVAVLRAAGIAGDFLPWRDVLHEGPLDPALPLEELSALRSAFIAQCGWATAAEARRQFEERDARLQGAAADDEVVLWFEHDLYDQLQLLQLLAWFHSHPHPRLSLVCEAEYLGEMAPGRAAALLAARKAIAPAQLELGARAWNHLNDLEGLIGKDLSDLPFLKAALQRWLEERPGADGLSRTEREALRALEAGPLELEELFRRTQAREEARFLGDTVFLKRLERLEKLGRVRRRGDRWEAV